MPFAHARLRVHAHAQAYEGPTIWHYDGGADFPSEVLRAGYFRSRDVKAHDRIMAVCHDGGVHMDLVVTGIEPIAVGVMARHPDGLAKVRKPKPAEDSA